MTSRNAVLALLVAGCAYPKFDYVGTGASGKNSVAGTSTIPSTRGGAAGASSGVGGSSSVEGGGSDVLVAAGSTAIGIAGIGGTAGGTRGSAAAAGAVVRSSTDASASGQMSFAGACMASGGSVAKGGAAGASGRIDTQAGTSARGGAVGEFGGTNARAGSTGSGNANGGFGGIVLAGGNAGTSGSGGSTIDAGAGGTSNPLGTAGTGCTSSFEVVDQKAGLCVAKLVAVGVAGARFSIDMTEVTQGQYDAWLGKNPQLGNLDPRNVCTGNASFQPDVDCAEHRYQGTNADHHPVVCIGWCDAYSYCLAIGKRLCGRIATPDGGALPYGDVRSPTESQWYATCTSGGVNLYPYGSYLPTACNGEGLQRGMTTPVGQVSTCVTASGDYQGVYDLSGNVTEWIDSCYYTGLPDSECAVLGGAYDGDASGDGCNSLNAGTRNVAYSTLGFRCCAD